MKGLETQNASLRQTLDHLGVGIFLIDDAGAVEHVNPAGEDLLRARIGLAVTLGKLVASGGSDKRLQDAVESVRSGRIQEIVDVVIDREFERPVIARIVPIASGGESAAKSGPAAAGCAVMIALPTASTRSQEQAFARTYRLTKAEAALLKWMMLGEGLAGAAGRLGVSKSTVQTHLSGAFAKTGVNKQTDLIRLVLSSSPSLRSGAGQA